MRVHDGALPVATTRMDLEVAVPSGITQTEVSDHGTARGRATQTDSHSRMTARRHGQQLRGDLRVGGSGGRRGSGGHGDGGRRGQLVTGRRGVVGS